VPGLQEVQLPALAAEAVRIVVETVYSGKLEVRVLRDVTIQRVGHPLKVICCGHQGGDWWV
jgi:hypothetical protein